MKLGYLGCLAGSAAALLFSGCATDENVAAVDLYRSPYTTTTRYSSTPVFVERRIVSIDNVQRTVPVYRAGDEYFYTYGGRRFAFTDYPVVTRTSRTRIVAGPAYSSGRYRNVDRTVVRTGYDEDERTVRRTLVRADALDDGTTATRVRTSRRVDIEDPALVGERVRFRDMDDMDATTRVTERRVRIRD